MRQASGCTHVQASLAQRKVQGDDDAEGESVRRMASRGVLDPVQSLLLGDRAGQDALEESQLFMVEELPVAALLSLGPRGDGLFGPVLLKQLLCLLEQAEQATSARSAMPMTLGTFPAMSLSEPPTDPAGRFVQRSPFETFRYSCRNSVLTASCKPWSLSPSVTDFVNHGLYSPRPSSLSRA
eukprot:7379259-Prymnesium_polylepis.3